MRPATVSALSIALAAGLLPLWDAVSRYQMLSALAGTGLGSSGGASFPLSGIAYPALAGAIGFALYRSFETAPARVPIVFGAACAWALIYAGWTAFDTALTRSHAIDSWNVCENPAVTAGGYPAYVSTLPRRPAFDGPHLPNGDPCVRESERRGEHLRSYPEGDVADGMVQIWRRFPKDRARTIWGSILVVVLLAVAGAALVRARRAAHGQR